MFYLKQYNKTILQFDIVEDNLDGQRVSNLKLADDIDNSLLPIGVKANAEFVENYSLRTVADYIRELGNEYYDEFVDMLIFDAVIYNEDRHFGNFGLIVDSKTNKPCSFAPIFDNGLSLFNFAMEDDLGNIEKYAKTRSSSYGVPFENIVKEFITPRQKVKLRKMIGFRFERNKSPKYNWSAKRLKAIEAFLQLRVAELLEY